jgi:hypothetical protein
VFVPDFVPGSEYDAREVRRVLGATTVDGSVVAGREGIALVVTIGRMAGRLDFPTRSSL